MNQKIVFDDLEKKVNNLQRTTWQQLLILNFDQDVFIISLLLWLYH